MKRMEGERRRPVPEAAGPATARDAASAQALQQSVGNRGVARLLRTPAAAAGTSAPAPAAASAPGRRVWAVLERAEGGGRQPLDGGTEPVRIEVTQYHMGSRAPTDASSLAPTGRRQYQLVTFKKAFDERSPLLFRALTENQPLHVRFEFTRDGVAGAAEQTYQTIELGGARVVQFDQSTDGAGDTEDVGIAFETITMTAGARGVTHQDTVGNAR
jgi:type VI secretion system Hcp family effector